MMPVVLEVFIAVAVRAEGFRRRCPSDWEKWCCSLSWRLSEEMLLSCWRMREVLLLVVVEGEGFNDAGWAGNERKRNLFVVLEGERSVISSWVRGWGKCFYQQYLGLSEVMLVIFLEPIGSEADTCDDVYVCSCCAEKWLLGRGYFWFKVAPDTIRCVLLLFLFCDWVLYTVLVSSMADPTQTIQSNL